MKTKLFAVVSALAVLGVASPASAVIVDVTYTGTVISGNGYVGDSWVANYVFDTTKGNYNYFSPTDNYASGYSPAYTGVPNSNPALSATVTINGSSTFSVDPNYYGRISAYDFGDQSQQSHAAEYEDAAGHLSYLINTITAPNGNISPSITGPYNYTAALGVDTTHGTYSNGTTGLLITASLQTLTVSSDIATPLPAALPLFASGLGVIGLLARRRKPKATAVLAAV